MSNYHLDAVLHEIKTVQLSGKPCEIGRLYAINQELLGALHSISLAAQDSGSTREGMGLYARAAIAKATGEMK